MERAEFVFETWIRASAESIWTALTTPEFTSRYFFATHVESSWEPGARVVYRIDGTAAVDGEVLEADPPRKLVLSWHVLHDVEAATEEPSRVTFRIDDLGEQCRLRIVHDRFPPESVVPALIADGWPYIAASLKSLLETGEPLPARSS